MPHRVIVADAPDAETFLRELDAWQAEERRRLELEDEAIVAALPADRREPARRMLVETRAVLDRPVPSRSAIRRRLVRINGVLAPRTCVTSSRRRERRGRARPRRQRSRARSPGRRSCADSEPDLAHALRAARRCA